MYNPYDGISDALGGRKAVFTLPEGPEFVFADDAAVKRRGWSEHLYFYTGTGYVAGGRRGDGCALQRRAAAWSGAQREQPQSYIGPDRIAAVPAAALQVARPASRQARTAPSRGRRTPWRQRPSSSR
jgi:hypothetical protein